MSAHLSRRGFLAGLGAGAALAAGLPAGAAAATADDALLNLALALEHLQAAFYSEAERLGALAHRGAQAAEDMGAVERAHVAALTAALGTAAQAPPLFAFGGATSDDRLFARTAVAIEDLSAAVQLALLPRLGSPERRALLASLHTVDAGHAAYLRLAAGHAPVTAALDDPVNPAEAVRVLLRGGHVRPRPGAASDDPWAASPGEGPGLLAAFPLGRRPVVLSPPSPTPVAPLVEAPEGGGGMSPWIPWLATTGGLSAIVIGAIGVHARRAARRVTVVGPDEGPVVSQQAATPQEVAAEDPAAQTAAMPHAGAARERERV